MVGPVLCCKQNNRIKLLTELINDIKNLPFSSSQKSFFVFLRNLQNADENDSSEQSTHKKKTL